jgi:hypothetical protein
LDIVITKTEANSFRRVLATNSAQSGPSSTPGADFITPTASNYQDTAGGVVNLHYLQGSRAVPNAVKIKFYGTGNDNTTGGCRVYGVSGVYTAASQDAKSYTYTLLGAFTFTLSGAVGVANGAVLDSERYADTITQVFGIANVTDKTYSPAAATPAINDIAAHVILDTQGFGRLFFDLYVTGGLPATNVNAIIAGV